MRTTEASVKGRVPVKRLFEGGKADLGLVGQVLARKPAPSQFLAHLGADHFVLFGGKVVVIHSGRNIPHIPVHFHHRVAEGAGRKTFFTLAKQAEVVVSNPSMAWQWG